MYVYPQGQIAKILLHFKEGVQAFNFWKHDFELWVGGGGLDMYPQQLKGDVGSKAKRKEIRLSVLHRSICLDELII